MLRRKDWAPAKGTLARDFIEARAGEFRLVYRFDRMSDSRPRETPQLGLVRERDD
jgi:hypothetical protein